MATYNLASAGFKDKFDNQVLSIYVFEKLDGTPETFLTEQFGELAPQIRQPESIAIGSEIGTVGIEKSKNQQIFKQARVIHNNQGYLFISTPKNETTSILFDQILSTLRFLE